MLTNLKDFLFNDFFVTGEPFIYAADIMIVLTSLFIIGILTYFKKWKWLWNEWITSVDHKKIGIMYMIASLMMLFRAGIDALMMRTQLMLPSMNFLDSQQYNEIFYIFTVPK